MRAWVFVVLLPAAACAVARVSVPTSPRLALHVSGNHFVDPAGRTVTLRGVASMGMGQVYGDKANPGTYVAMTPTQYVDRAIQTDSTGNVWYANAIRLNFERFPSANPTRLYSTENRPYAIPETLTFTAWQTTTQYAEGDIRTAGGSRYRGVRKSWRADKGAAWNLPAYRVGDLVVGLLEGSTNVYRCTAANTTTGTGGSHWDHYPRGTTTYHEDEDAWSYEWAYVGAYGTSGATSPDHLTPISDNGVPVLVDNLMQWTYLSPDYTASQAEANFADWKAKVMDPVVKRAIDDGLYVVICEFDFGPAHLPLRSARMLDFWPRMAKAWGNTPNVLFELWNESEDIGSFAGGFGSWSKQKPAIQAVVNAIRAAGANNIVLIPTPLYSTGIGEATADPVDGTNLAYTLHQYRNQWDAYGANRDQINEGLARAYPIVMTEWGDGSGEPDATKQWPDRDTPEASCRDQNFSRPCPAVTLRQLLEPTGDAARPAAGWFAWSLSETWEPVLFQRDSRMTTPTPFGAATRQWLADRRADSQPFATPTAAAPAGLRPQVR